VSRAVDNHDPRFGAAAFFLATQLPDATDTSPEDLVDVWTHEWDDESETWGVALNGTGQDRVWHGQMYNLPTDDTVGAMHPAGTAVIAINQQALGVLKPDHNEWFCEQDAIGIWEKAAFYALHDRLDDLGGDPPTVQELLEVASDGE
jgi:hypothetical protein